VRRLTVSASQASCEGEWRIWAEAMTATPMFALQDDYGQRRGH
jgi:hypothetical protein